MVSARNIEKAHDGTLADGHLWHPDCQVTPPLRARLSLGGVVGGGAVTTPTIVETIRYS